MPPTLVKQLNVRCSLETLEAYRKGQKRRGLSQSEYLRFLVTKDLEIPATQLGSSKLAAIPPAPSATSTPAAGAPPTPAAVSDPDDFEVELAQWVSNRGFMPVALARSAITGGRFTIDGEPYKEPKCPLSRLKGAKRLEISGRPI